MVRKEEREGEDIKKRKGQTEKGKVGEDRKERDGTWLREEIEKETVKYKV